MALDTQLVPVTLRQGVNTKDDPKQLITGQMITLQNAVFTTPKMLRKRNGYTALSQNIVGGGTISAGMGLSSYKNELVELDGKNLYSYTPDLTEFSKQLSNTNQTLIPTSLTTTSVLATATGFSTTDYAYHAGSGLACIVGWQNSVGLVYSIIDTTTGDQLVSYASALINPNSSIQSVKILTLGKFFVIIAYNNSGPAALVYTYIPTDNVTNPTVATQIASSSNFDTSNPFFDATVINGFIFVGFSSIVSTHSIAVARLSVSGNTVVLAGTALSQTGERAQAGLTVFGDASNNLWVAYYNGTAVRVFISDFPTDITLSNPLVLNPTTVETISNIGNITGIVSGTTATFYYDRSAALTFNYSIRTNTVTQAGSVGSPAVIQLSLGLASKAFAYGVNNYVLASYQSPLQSTFFLLDMSNPIRPAAVAKIAPGLGGGLVGVLGSNTPPILPEVVSPASGIFIIPFLQENQFYTISNSPSAIVNGVCTAQITFKPVVQMLEAGNDLLITGGSVMMYDGVQAVEHGFHLYPETPTAITNASAGSMAAGTYQYVVMWLWVDNRGQVFRSAPSVAVSITTSGGSSNVVLTIPTLRVTQKTNGTVFGQVFRTTVNGTIFFALNNPALNSSNNNTNNDSYSFTDGVADSGITGNIQLYTTGGEVINNAAPATVDMCSYKARVILLPSEVTTSWWYSKQTVPGFPIEFSEFFVQNETQTGGGFTACDQMDDKLVIFKQNTLGYVVGDGPSINGTGNDFTPWQQIVSETGCNNAASLVLTPDGLMYQSPKGIYLLDRSLKDHYIGADVEGALGTATVTSAQLIPNTTQVRMTLNNGTELVYDYFVKDDRGIGQWDVSTNISAVASALFQGQFTYVTSGGQVLQETSGTFTDNGTGIVMKLVTGWISFAGIQGYQRVRKFLIVGDYKSAHTLKVQIAYDFDSTIVQTDNITASSTPPYQYRINLARQKCEAIQITIQDASETGESFDISALTFEVGVKKGPQRMAPTRSFG